MTRLAASEVAALDPYKFMATMTPRGFLTGEGPAMAWPS